MKIKENKNNQKKVSKGKFWSFIFLLSAILLAVNIFSTKCGNNSFIPKETTICGAVNVDILYFVVLFIFFIISFYFSFQKISCVFSHLKSQRILKCSISTSDTLTVCMFLVGLFLLSFSIYGYYLNKSFCSEKETEIKKIKLMELKGYVELSYENSDYYPYYYSNKSYPDSFQDMVDNGTLSEEEVTDFEKNGYAIRKVEGEEDYFIEANFFREERKLFCENTRSIVKTYYCNKNYCMFN
ncbi:hypothetical protein K0B03_01255 [Patescibacteria group bacterium]|nr:hypothetical protein [Patescibacteria group bacterium]